MTNTKAAKPCVFLSSTFQEGVDGERREVPLRRRIVESRRLLPINLGAYELVWPKDAETPAPGADTVIDRCFAGIRNCDLFVFLLTARHGTSVEYVEGGILASYLELELFAAAILRKPVLVLHLRGRDPERPLRDTLDLLHSSFAAGCYVIDDENGLYSRFRAECDRFAAGDRVPPEPILTQLPDWLSHWRTQASLRRELTDPRLRFLDGSLIVALRRRPDQGRASA
jgi:hypothetical protein